MGRRGENGVEDLKMHQDENLSHPAQQTLETLPQEEGADVAPVTADYEVSCSSATT